MDIHDIVIYLSKGYKVMLSNIFSHVLLLGSLSCYNRKKMEACFNDWEVCLATTTNKWACVLIIGQCVLLQYQGNGAMF